ncbi:MAG TPA: glycosyltransferase [Armatimonadota bacterium]|jgi:glycosyltransferase involved in cell wall biosynthesis
MAIDPTSRPLRIAVVTPLFPLDTEPYRGIPIYHTVVQLARFAEVEAFVPLAVYPPVSWLQPKSYIYRRANTAWQPGGVRTHYCEYYVLPHITRPFNGRLAVRRLTGPIRAFRPDLILAYWLYPEGYAACLIARQLGVPVVVGSRGTDLRPPEPFSSRGTRTVLAEAAAVLTVSSELRDRALELGANAASVHVILNGCDSSIFTPGSRIDARAELGLNPDSKIVLFAGHLIPVKGVKDLLTAAISLAARHPKLVLVFVGEGYQQAELQATLTQSGSALPVHFAGSCTPRQVARWMHACNVFCLPSLNEGCPNVVIEALSSGRPVVASSVGAIPDLVDQSRGELTPPQNPDALAAALERTLNRNWDDDALSASMQRGWDTVAQETLAVCQTALSGGRR